MTSVSSANNSPGRRRRPLDSLNQGLVRGPEVRRRVSTNSPPCRITSPYINANSSCSEIPGFTASRTAATANSAAAMLSRRQAISSSVLIRRT
jgi:hypothetical protein